MSHTLSNTLGVPCRVPHLEVVRREADLPAALARAGPQALIVGGRSNLVLPERLLRPVLIVAWRGIRCRCRGDTVLLDAAAGESWHGLVRYSLGQGLGGLENLALIPGRVGAAPIQNIGAYGVELASRVDSVRVFDRDTGAVRALTAPECEFGYRDSIFRRNPGAMVVLSVTLKLAADAPAVLDYPDVATELARRSGAHVDARAVAEAIIRIRRRKLPDPRRCGNVGSFFKNPVVVADQAAALRAEEPALVAYPAAGGVKLAAAQLIDLCGWKGRQVGDVAVWRRQPLVLVNRGRASGRDFLRLSEQIAESVQRRFGVSLEYEPDCLAE